MIFFPDTCSVLANDQLVVWLHLRKQSKFLEKKLAFVIESN